MNLKDLLSIYDVHHNTVLEIVYEPAALELLVLLKTGEIDKLGYTLDGEVEIDVLASVEFACFLKKARSKDAGAN